MQLTTNLADDFPTLYMRYVDDTLVSMPDVPSAQHFLVTLNNLHANLNFTMELPSFIGSEIVKNETILETRVYRKPTNTGLLLHYQSHADVTKVMQTYVTKNPFLKSCQFHVLKKCSSKFNCLVYEMLFIRKLKPSLNVQSDSMNAKLFT